MSNYYEVHQRALARVNRFAAEHPLIWAALVRAHGEPDVRWQLGDRRRRTLRRRAEMA